MSKKCSQCKTHKTENLNFYGSRREKRLRRTVRFLAVALGVAVLLLVWNLCLTTF